MDASLRFSLKLSADSDDPIAHETKEPHICAVLLSWI